MLSASSVDENTLSQPRMPYVEPILPSTNGSAGTTGLDCLLIATTDRLSCFLSVFDQRRNAIRNGCTQIYPMGNTIQVQTQCFSLARSQWVEETYAFDETTVTSVAAVGHYYLIKRTLFCAATC